MDQVPVEVITRMFNVFATLVDIELPLDAAIVNDGIHQPFLNIERNLYQMRRLDLVHFCQQTRQGNEDYLPGFSGREYINNAAAIRPGTVRRVWFAVRTAVGIFLAIVKEIFVSFDSYNRTIIKQQ